MTAFDDAFRYDIDPFTGGWHEAQPSVRRSISGLIRQASRVWIGIASNGDDGCRTRWNRKYKGLGMRHMAAVYRTSSEGFRRSMEADLIDFYEDFVENCVGGGGGPDGTAPFTVYVVWK